jgi:nucleotide-binding universal stress UspA family protein
MYKTILAPLDGSRLSECALEHVKQVAHGCQVGQVVLFTVVEQLALAYAEYSTRERIEEDVREKQEAGKRAVEKAEKYLAEAKDNLTKEGISVESVVFQAEENQAVADAILSYAERNGVDLIIMSTHGRSGITRWALGSVADRVVRHSKIPVLSVAPAGCRK